MRLALGTSRSNYTALVFLASLTAFCVSGFLIYIPTTVYYSGMERDVSALSIVLGASILVASFVMMRLEKEVLLPHVFFWVFFVLSNVLYFIFYKSWVAIPVLNLLFFWLFLKLSPKAALENFEFPEAISNAFLVVGALVAFYFFRENGYRFDAGLLVFEGVYDVRFDVTFSRNMVENIMFSTTTKCILLLPLAHFTMNGRYLKAGLALLFLIVLYSTSAQKSIMFFAAIVFVAGLSVRFPRSAGVTLVVASLALWGLAFSSQQDGAIANWIHAFLTRRLLLLPAWLNQQFIVFWTEPMLLRHSILPGVFAPEYEGPGPTWELGYYLWGFGTSLNNGIFSDGYMNFGAFGVLVYMSIGVATLSRLARSPFAPVRIVSVMYVWQLSNSALITTFVTHGLAAFLLGAIIVERRQKHVR